MNFIFCKLKNQAYLLPFSGQIFTLLSTYPLILKLELDSHTFPNSVGADVISVSEPYAVQSSKVDFNPLSHSNSNPERLHPFWSSSNSYPSISSRAPSIGWKKKLFQSSHLYTLPPPISNEVPLYRTSVTMLSNVKTHATQSRMRDSHFKEK